MSCVSGLSAEFEFHCFNAQTSILVHLNFAYASPSMEAFSLTGGLRRLNLEKGCRRIAYLALRQI
jgi:hypothetical protein